MTDFIQTKLGQEFCHRVMSSCGKIAEELKHRNELAEAALYPYPDLCRRCKRKDTNYCVECVPISSAEKRAKYFKSWDDALPFDLDLN